MKQKTLIPRIPLIDEKPQAYLPYRLRVVLVNPLIFGDQRILVQGGLGYDDSVERIPGPIEFLR